MGLDPGLDHNIKGRHREGRREDKRGEIIREWNPSTEGQQQFIQIQIFIGTKGCISVLLLGSDNGGEGRVVYPPLTSEICITWGSWTTQANTPSPTTPPSGLFSGNPWAPARRA